MRIVVFFAATALILPLKCLADSACARHFSSLSKTRQKLSEAMAGGQSSWPIDGQHNAKSSYESYKYNAVFKAALNGNTLENFARDRKARGKSTHVTDFFGSAIFSPEPQVFDSLTGIRLEPAPRELTTNSALEHPRWSEVLGDLTQSSTWRKLDQNTTERKIGKFDLITIRPEGPAHIWDNQVSKAIAEGDFTNSQNLMTLAHSLLDRAWQRLSTDDGVMLVQVPIPTTRNPAFLQWLDRLAKAGVQTQIFESAPHLAMPFQVEPEMTEMILRIDKTATSPQSLPK